MSKNFTATKALDSVDLDVYSGEVHALLGENGAGKSTLIKILTGVYDCRQGSLIYHGREIGLDVDKLSLAVIHQDLGLAESMTITENIAITAGYQRKGGFIDWKKTREHARELLVRMDCDIDPDTNVSLFAAAERSIVAISRALSKKVDILILDEPTATLPQQDVDKLFDLLNRLRQQGIAIIYVTHRLDEVFQISQRITVLRNGMVVNTAMTEDTTPQQLISDIIGRDADDVFVKAEYLGNPEVALEVKDMNTGFVGPVSFKLHRGEVLALFGLRGSGHHEVGRCLWGVEKMDSGAIIVKDRPVGVRSSADGIRLRFGFVSSKRHEEGLAASFSVRENMYINPVIDGRGLYRPLRIDEEQTRCAEAIRKYSIKTDDGEDAIGTLSGGNQQKVMIARWFDTNCDVLILEEPTIGVDVGAKAEIYSVMKQGLSRGEAIILISSDSEEVSRIAHRVIVFDKGAIVKEVTGDDIEIDYLTALATGVID